MLYAVTCRNRRGAQTIVYVEADSGDDAAAKAFKPYIVIAGIAPASSDEIGALKKAKALNRDEVVEVELPPQPIGIVDAIRAFFAPVKNTAV